MTDIANQLTIRLNVAWRPEAEVGWAEVKYPEPDIRAISALKGYRMSQLDGLFLGVVDKSWDWVSSLSSGGPFENLIWDSVGKDENNVEHFINKINCRYNEENGQAWWVQRCKTSDNGFEYLLCHSYADSNIVFIEATKTLSYPERKALRPDRYNLKTRRLHGENLANAIKSGSKLSPFDEAFNQTTIWGQFDGYENEYPYVDFGLGVHTVNLNPDSPSVASYDTTRVDAATV